MKASMEKMEKDSEHKLESEKKMMLKSLNESLLDEVINKTKSTIHKDEKLSNKATSNLISRLQFQGSKMKDKNVAKAYAKAIYNLGKESNLDVAKELTTLTEVVNENNNLENVMFLDVFTAEEKIAVVNEVI